MATSPLETILERIGSEKRIKLGLDRFQQALDSTGNPEKSVQTLVIGGTNGKGSTSLFVSSALFHSGFRVGTFLSPHLQQLNERFLLNLCPISQRELEELGEELAPAAEKFELSYFEFVTLLCFHWAKRSGLDFLVLEVGMGGRLDSTNVTNPIAVAITNIGLDHQKYLGSTLESILEEKLGILRPEGLLFTGVREPELLEKIEKRCADLDAIYYYAKELKVETGHADWGGQTFSLNGYAFQVTNPSSGTIENAALAFLMMRIVFPRIPIPTLQAAFRAVRTPGRMEVVADRPRIVLSGDHNPDGIACLKRSLSTLKTGRLHTVCAFSPDKPHAKMFEELKGISQEIFLTRNSCHADDLPSDYARLAPLILNPEEAVEKAMHGLGADDTLLVTGSLYLVGELRKLWRSRVEFLDSPGRGWERPARKMGASTRARFRPEEEEQNP